MALYVRWHAAAGVVTTISVNNQMFSKKKDLNGFAPVTLSRFVLTLPSRALLVP